MKLQTLIIIVMLLCIGTIIPVSALAPAFVESIDPVLGVNNATITNASITGLGFENEPTLGVKLIKGSIEIFASNVLYISNTTVTCDLPINGSETGLYDVLVTNDGTNYKVDTAVFTILNPTPTVTAINPPSARNTGNVSGVLIRGSDFVDGAAVMVSRFDPVLGRASGWNVINGENVMFINGTALSCDLPIKNATPGTWDVSVTNPGNGDEIGTLPGGFTINGPPPLVIDTITPATGTNMEIVQTTIAGTNFTRIASAYLVNETLSIPGTIVSQTNTSLRCSFRLVGSPNLIYSLLLMKTDGGSGSLDDCFMVINASPSITAITPSSGYNCTDVRTVITGANFRSNPSVTLINGSTVITGSLENRSLTTISCTFPVNGSPAGMYNLTVTNIDGTSATRPGAFTIREALFPNITSFTPAVAVNNTAVSYCINGTNFEQGAKVWITNGSRIFGISARSITRNQIIGGFSSIPLPHGIYNLTVQNPYNASATMQSALTLKSPTPLLAPAPILPGSAYNTSSIAATVKGTPLYSGVQITMVNGSKHHPGSGHRIFSNTGYRDI